MKEIKNKIEEAILNNHRITVCDHMGNILEEVIPVSFEEGVLKSRLEENSDIIEFLDVYQVTIHK